MALGAVVTLAAAMMLDAPAGARDAAWPLHGYWGRFVAMRVLLAISLGCSLCGTVYGLVLGARVREAWWQGMLIGIVSAYLAAIVAARVM